MHMLFLDKAILLDKLPPLLDVGDVGLDGTRRKWNLARQLQQGTRCTMHRLMVVRLDFFVFVVFRCSILSFGNVCLDILQRVFHGYNDKGRECYFRFSVLVLDEKLRFCDVKVKLQHMH